jgi:hypothetical protein
MRVLTKALAGFNAPRWLVFACAFLFVADGYGLLASALQRRADASPIAPARAAALLQATSSEQLNAVRAIGDDARMINAAMPFTNAPVVSARAFIIPAGDDLDRRRALLCLTQAVYYEAGYEPVAGRRAVAQVVLNRMRHPAYPKSICGVVYQRNATPVCQFSFVCDGSLDRRPSASAWKQAEQIAREALGGYVEKSVGQATFYHADYVAPRWAPMLAKINQIGAHIFYRFPGGWGQPSAFGGRYAGEPRDPATMRPLIVRQPDGELPVGEEVVATGPITDGTVLKRAPNDVGGLLDTSKGWTLNIPLPGDKPPVEAAESVHNEAPAQSRVIASR